MLSFLAAALVAASPDAILIADEDGHYVEANPAALALLGYTREALLRLSVTDIVAPGPIWAAEEYARSLREGVWQGEVEVRTNAGSVVPAEARAIVVPGPDGSCYASFLRDLTERKQAEETLRQSEERFRTAFADAAIGMSLVDLEGRFLQVNAALCALTGYAEAELLARTFQDISHPDDLAADVAQVARLLAGESRTFQMEKRYLRQDGEVVWIRISTALIRDEDGAPLHLIDQVEDITARVRAEEGLRTSESRYRILVEQLPAVVYIMANDARQTPLFYSTYIETLTGETPQEVVALGEHWLDLVHPADRAWVAAQNARTGATGEPFSAEFRRRRTDGSYVWVRDEAVPLRDEDGQISAWQGVMLDITAQKLAEEELRAALETAQAANRAKGVFLDMMSHELRTPLQAVLGYSEFLLLAPQASLTAEQRQDIGDIHQAGDRMLALVNQLLDLSALEAGGIDLAVEPIDLIQIIASVGHDVSPQAAAKGLAVHIDLPASLPSLTGDAERLRQILRNLASNAVKFTHAGQIRLAAAATASGGVEVEVSDTGVGITADALLHVFEAFRQGDSSHTRRHGGSGVGLAIAWQLARQMGGSLSVTSEPEVGSTFRLHLPGAPPRVGRRSAGE